MQKSRVLLEINRCKCRMRRYRVRPMFLTMQPTEDPLSNNWGLVNMQIVGFNFSTLESESGIGVDNLFGNK